MPSMTELKQYYKTALSAMIRESGSGPLLPTQPKNLYDYVLKNKKTFNDNKVNKQYYDTMRKLAWALDIETYSKVNLLEVNKTCDTVLFQLCNWGAVVKNPAYMFFDGEVCTFIDLKNNRVFSAGITLGSKIDQINKAALIVGARKREKPEWQDRSWYRFYVDGKETQILDYWLAVIFDPGQRWRLIQEILACCPNGCICCNHMTNDTSDYRNLEVTTIKNNIKHFKVIQLLYQVYGNKYVYKKIVKGRNGEMDEKLVCRVPIPADKAAEFLDSVCGNIIDGFKLYFNIS